MKRPILSVLLFAISLFACVLPGTATSDDDTPVTFAPVIMTMTSTTTNEATSTKTPTIETPSPQGFVSPDPNNTLFESYLGISYTFSSKGTVDRFSDIGGDAKKHSLIAIYNGNKTWVFITTFGNIGNGDVWLKLWPYNSSATPAAPNVPTFIGGYKDCVLDGPGVNARWDDCNVFVGEGDYFTFAGTVVNAGQYVPAEGSLTGYQPIHKYTITPTATP